MAIAQRVACRSDCLPRPPRQAPRHPHGVLGEPEYEAAALLGNPNTRLRSFADLPAVMARRLDILRDALEYDRQRMLRWGIAFQALSAWWSLEDATGDAGPALAALDALARINLDTRYTGR